jgi:diguanylate cyclase (GGDEF)-like protein/hemerythrin-like metal-binding protein/PAS domain S-box-containing protein
MELPPQARKSRVRKAKAQPAPDGGEKFRLAFEMAGVGMGLVDQQRRFFEVNKKLSEIFAIAKEELLRMTIDALPVPAGDTPALHPAEIVLKSDRPLIPFEKRFVTRQGEIVWVEVSYSPLAGQRGRPDVYIVSFHDITARKTLELALARQASVDPMTQALNRPSFAERASIELLRSGRHRYKLSLVMVDLDHFKAINDTYGHAAGDQVLSIFGDMTRSCLRMMDLFGRWGGEEFLLLLPDAGPAGAKRVSERIRASLESYRFPCGAQVTASFGVAARRAGENLGALVDRADAAMYEAKQSGRNRVVVDAEDVRRESTRKRDSVGVFELHWRKLYSCGIDKIDTEHEQLFAMANRILAALSSAGDTADMKPLVDDLLTHIATHFEHEEQLLEVAGFPELEAHRLNHRKLLAHARDLAEQFRQQQAAAGALLGFVIHDVVATHMIRDDRKYYSWMRKTKSAGKGKQRLPQASRSA